MGNENIEGIRPRGIVSTSLNDVNALGELRRGEIVVSTDNNTDQNPVSLYVTKPSPSSSSDLLAVPVQTSVPSSSTATGYLGQWAVDSSYFYICRATDTWERIAWDTTSW